MNSKSFRQYFFAWSVLLLLAHSALAQTWIKTSVPNENWSGIASSADGDKLVAAATSGAIYTSTNAGLHWIRQTNAPAAFWGAVASSANGDRLVCATFDGSIYTSTNAGITWTLKSFLPLTTWISVAASSDGSNLAIVDEWDTLAYLSSNFGETWSSNSIATLDNSQSFGYSRSIASSADGTKLAVATLVGSIFVSTNSGVSWTLTSAPVTNWSSIASSANGTKLAATDASGGNIYTSQDSGATWTLQANVPNAVWYSIASSSDGSKLVAVAGGYAGNEPGPICTSSDFGVTWTRNDAPDDYWYYAASSADGSKLAAVVYGGGIYIWHYLPTLNIKPIGSQVLLSWPSQATNFLLQQCSDASAKTWLLVTNAPVLNPTNMQNQVLLSPCENACLYRLAKP